MEHLRLLKYRFGDNVNVVVTNNYIDTWPYEYFYVMFDIDGRLFYITDQFTALRDNSVQMSVGKCTRGLMNLIKKASEVHVYDDGRILGRPIKCFNLLTKVTIRNRNGTEFDMSFDDLNDSLSNGSIILFEKLSLERNKLHFEITFSRNTAIRSIEEMVTSVKNILELYDPIIVTFGERTVRFIYPRMVTPTLNLAYLATLKFHDPDIWYHAYVCVNVARIPYSGSNCTVINIYDRSKVWQTYDECPFSEELLLSI